MSTNNEVVENMCYAIQLVSSASLPMVLVNTIRLGVLKTIAEAGPNARLSSHEIASRLLIQNQNAPEKLDRMLRLLASHSVVTCSIGEREFKPVRMYGLAPVAKYLVPDQDGVTISAWMELLQDKVCIDTWYELKDSVIEGGIPFDKVHGMHAFEYPAIDEKFNKVFNNAMVNYGAIVMNEVIKSYHDFDNLKCLVDVGGGLGTTLNTIVSKYTNINGINFDLPHVIRNALHYPGIKHVGGDMFDNIPQGDALFMKWVLHDWDDDHCLKLLKNCYKALPDDGKIIVVEAVLPFLPDTSSSVKATTQTDAIMMTQTPCGKERTEDEFIALAKAAGFHGIKKKCFVCNFWVMEFYK